MNIVLGFRGVAQLGRAPRSGRGGRRFESCHLDHNGSIHMYAAITILSIKKIRCFAK